MMSYRQVVFTALFLLLSQIVISAPAADRSTVMARQNYILNCQGCHLADGSGFKDKVPKMTDFVAYFLHVEGGREFIVQVPGAANAPISDKELADVMNWLLHNFSRAQLPEAFLPYTEAEVARLRKSPMIDINSRRVILIERIQSKLGIREDGLGG